MALGVASHGGVRHGLKRRAKLFRGNALRGEPPGRTRVRHQEIHRWASLVDAGNFTQQRIARDVAATQSQLCVGLRALVLSP